MGESGTLETLRSYQDRAEHTIALTRLARRCLPEFRQHEELIEEKLYPASDQEVEYLILYHVDKTLVGAAALAVHGPSGRRVVGIRTLLVDPAYRRRAVASKLIRAAELEATNYQASRLWLYCSLPNYLYPGAPLNDVSIAQFAQALGFRPIVNTYDMGVDLQHKTFGTHYSVGEINPVRTLAETEQLFAFCSEHFPAFLKEVRMAMGRCAPIAFVAISGGQVVGFCVAGSNNVPLGAIGPAGILPNHRRGNSFRCLLEGCMSELQRRGHDFVRMQWSDPRSPTFYRRYFDGFVCDEFVIYGKDLECLHG